MWIADIDVPQSVLDAAEVNRLVFFVGAGASRAHPANLPDFAKLVHKIGTLAGRTPTIAELDRPDVFLGRLEDTKVDVHRLVAKEIEQPDSQPNSLHIAISRLAVACGTPRIVTTNYDRHLTAASASLSPDISVYEAPALPVGDDFEGIVHLHGSLNQPNRRLVVTDSDFGRAYLREAWAARFLERMFSTFTVVFIGYSHGDVVMQYLARSLGSDQNRYVLTDDAQNAEWRRLGLTPITYPNDTCDHSALPAALERWGELATMGHVEHRARIAGLVSGEPPTIPEEISYIEAALAHPDRIQYFVEKARFDDDSRAHRWFRWVEGRSAFPGLFLFQEASKPTSRVLMSWITDQFILSEKRSGLALRAFCERPWPPDTWYAIAQRVFSGQSAVPRWLNPWIQLILQKAPSLREDLIDTTLADKDWSANFDLALMIFEDRTRPYLKRALDFGASTEAPRFEVDLCGTEYWLTRSWVKTFVPALDLHLKQLLALVTERIAGVYRSLRSVDSERTFDPITFSRSAIESHEQDSHRDPIDVLIDAARDCIEFAISNDPPLARHFLGSWARSADTVLRRLSVHGWRLRADVDSDAKLIWLREQDLLWDFALQHEVFLLIRDALPTASDDRARTLVEDAVAGPPEEAAGDNDHLQYRSYNLLGWLADSAPDLSVAKAAFVQAQESHRNWDYRDHPDLNHYSSTGRVEDRLPFTAAELHTLVTEGPDQALTQLRAFQANNFAFDGPTWTGALRSLQACIAEYPEDGGVIAHALRAEDNDFRISLIRGWDQATLNDALAEQVLTIIVGWDHVEIRKPACSMLSNGGDPDHPTAWHQFVSARRLASRLWPTTSVDGAVAGGADILTESINHPAGDLAEFWTKAVQYEWSKAESVWDGIPKALTAELDRLISATGSNGLLARAFLTSQLHFFFAADREWCETHLLPLFDWEKDGQEAAGAWQGFLAWGRWNDGLLQAGLLDSYIATTSHTDELSNDFHRQLAIHLASIAMYAPDSPSTWLSQFVVSAPPELRVEWARAVDHALTRSEQGDTRMQWDRWIGTYWSERNQSVPCPLTPDEASVTACWVFGLSGVRSQAIDLALESEADIGEHGEFLVRLKQFDIAAEAYDWARLLTHLLKNTSGPQGGISYRLREIIPRLREGDPEPDLSELIDKAMRLGVTNAPDL